MHRAVVNAFLVLLLLAPLGQAQWVTDEQGDARETVAGMDASYGRAGASDIHSIDVEETEEELTFILAHADPPANEMEFVDSTFYSLYFNHGEQQYRLSVQRVTPVGEDAPEYYTNLYEEGNQYSYLGRLDAEQTEDGFKVAVAKDLLLDQHGAMPAKGSALTGFYAVGTTQSFGTICIDRGDCLYVGPRATDRAPDEGEATPYAFQYGLAQDGTVRLHSPAPVRWSNGEATTFVYEVIAANDGNEAETLTFQISEVPAGWLVADVPSVQLQPGEERAIPLPVKVPFAHDHGGDPRFQVEAYGKNGVGRIELGVHYPAIPQPTGHHSQVHIHTRTQDVWIVEELLYNTLGGNLGEVAYMNTVEDHDADEGVAVMGAKGGIGTGLDRAIEGDPSEYGVIYQWAIPLSPSLRVGLQTDAVNDTEGEVSLAFDVPVGEVRTFGRLAVVDQELLSDRFIDVDTEAGETVAVIPESETQSVSGSVTVPFTIDAEEADTFAYASGQALVLYLEAHVLRPDFILSPNTGVYLTGGTLNLPLREYHDAVPVNVTFPEEVQEDAIQSLDAPQAAEEAKDTPMAGPAALIGALGLATWRLRRNG